MNETRVDGGDSSERCSPSELRLSEVERYRRFENLHIYLWLFKDMCWCFDLKTLGMIMIVPTIIGAVTITWLLRRHVVELVHNLAVCLWILANGTWMFGEFYLNDTTRPWALVFFVAGISLLTIFYLAQMWGLGRRVGHEAAERG